MRKYLVGLLLVGGLAGCSSEWDPDRSASVEAEAKSNQGPTPASLALARQSSLSFASLPDRGELLQYSKDRSVRKSGAYTFHPVALSEAHALNAIASGKLQVAMPDGRALRLDYERHEEQPDGNWTWIGRSEDGSSAVLTFGEKAVFGIIDRGNAHYRVRTDRAGAWIVETDPLLASWSGHGMRDGGADYLLPGEGAGQQLAAAARRAEKSVSTAEAAPDKAVAVVDVLLGFSNGLAARIGSQSGASTYLASLVAITNAAYGNSGVTMRLRLVHSMQVSYADTSSNKNALQSLTGYNADTQSPIAVDPAFTAFRAARETYGADLVALVRNYQEPEQNGCGIAWLLGMDQSGISAANDASFGYAVVSDGSDRDESDGNTYFCSTYALAHELGHLMGQAHNTADSNGHGGAHTYSYGYRESSATGFFTIMAYPSGDAQIEIPNFANPSVNFSGRPTGVANASDNVRSMNLTMPIIGGFRATVVPLRQVVQDVNGDNRSDMLFHNAGTRQFSYRIMNGTTVARSSLIGGVGAGYTVAATGDFNGDGFLDVVWTSSRRDLYMWRGNGNTFTSTYFGDYPAGWQVVGAGDIDGDGRADLLFHNATTRQFSYRIMNGTSVTRTGLIGGVGQGYRVAAVGDLNGDGRADIVWTSNNRDLYVWTGNGTTFTSRLSGTYPAGWQVVGAGDVNNDGKDDLLFHNASMRQFSYRLMNGAAVTGTRLIGGVGAGYTVAAVGDYNGDGFIDIVWTSSRRDLYMWRGNGTTFTSTAFGTYPSGWAVIRR